MKRPNLHRIPLASVLPIGVSSGVMATLSEGQWDHLLAALYQNGAVLLELDANERPVAAYRKPGQLSGTLKTTVPTGGN